MKTNHSRATDDIAWGKSLLKSFILLIAAFFVISTAAVFISGGYLETNDFFDNWKKIALYPTAVALFWFLIILFTSHILFRISTKLQIYTFLFLCTCLVFSLATFYCQYEVAVVFFLLPMLISVTYFKVQYLNFSCVINVVAYVALVSFRFICKGKIYSNAAILGSVATITAFYYIALIIQRRQNILWKKIETTTEKSWRDSLTGLYNYATFYKELELRFSIYKNNNQPFCLLLFDVDNFKKINDKFGHAIGDEVLLAFVKTINHSLEYKDMAFRHGGEEFAVITNAPLEDAYALSESIRTSFTSYMQRSEHKMNATVSAGICKFDMGKFANVREFYEAADAALYIAKNNGKDQSVIWTKKK